MDSFDPYVEHLPSKFNCYRLQLVVSAMLERELPVVPGEIQEQGLQNGRIVKFVIQKAGKVHFMLIKYTEGNIILAPPAEDSLILALLLVYHQLLKGGLERATKI